MYLCKDEAQLIDQLEERKRKAISFKSKYDKNSLWLYNMLKMKSWEGHPRSDLLPKIEYPGVYLSTIKEQGIFNQGHYDVVCAPMIPNPLNARQAALMQNVARVKWNQHDMPSLALGILFDMTWAGTIVTGSFYSPIVEDFVTEIMPPEHFFVAPGTRDFDHTCAWVWRRIPTTLEAITQQYGYRVAQQAERLKTPIKRGNSGSDGNNLSRVGVLPSGQIDYYTGGRAYDFDEELEIDEWWIREGKKIRRITVIGQRIVDDLYVMFPKYPFVKWPANYVPNEFYCIPAGQAAANINKPMNWFETYLLDYVIRNTYQVTVISKQSNVNPIDLDNNPSNIFYVDGNPNDVWKTFAPQPLSGAAFGYTNHLARMLEQSSFSDAQAGIASGGNRSAAQTSQLLAAGQTGVSLKASIMGAAAGRWAKLQWDLEKTYARKVLSKYSDNPTKRIIEISGAQTSDDVLALQAAMVEDPNVHVLFDFASGLPNSVEIKEQKAMQLFEKQVISKSDLLEAIRWPNREEIIRRDEEAAKAQAMAMQQAGAAQPAAQPAARPPVGGQNRPALMQSLGVA